MTSTPNSTVEASTTSSSPSSCMASNNNAPKYGTRIPNRVFVGGLSGETTEAEMKELFSSYGEVTSIKIIQDRAGVSKGYGFVTFENEEQARNLLRHTEVYLKSRKLNIAPAIKKFDVNMTFQSPFPRTFDTASPSIPNGSVYFTPTGYPFTFQSNGMSYYNPAAAMAIAQQQQLEAYNAAAASYVQQHQQQQQQQQHQQQQQQSQSQSAQAAAPNAAATAAAQASFYNYMYPASAQTVYAPQQYYQNVPTPPPPSLHHSAAMIAYPAYNMPIAFVPLAPDMVHDYGAAQEFTGDNQQQAFPKDNQVSLEGEFHHYLPVDNMSTPPPNMVQSGDLQPYSSLLLPQWSPMTPPPSYTSADSSPPRQPPAQKATYGSPFRGGGPRRGNGPRGRGGRFGPGGDFHVPDHSRNNNNRRDVPSRMNGSPRHHYKSELSSATASPKSSSPPCKELVANSPASVADEPSVLIESLKINN